MSNLISIADFAGVVAFSVNISATTSDTELLGSTIAAFVSGIGACVFVDIPGDAR